MRERREPIFHISRAFDGWIQIAHCGMLGNDKRVRFCSGTETLSRFWRDQICAACSREAAKAAANQDRPRIHLRLRAPCECFAEIIRRRVRHQHAAHDVIVEALEIPFYEGVPYPEEMAESFEIIGPIDDHTERCLRREFNEAFFGEAMIGHEVRVQCDGDNAGDADLGAEWIGVDSAITHWPLAGSGLYDLDARVNHEALCGFQLMIVACPYLERLRAIEHDRVVAAMPDRGSI